MQHSTPHSKVYLIFHKASSLAFRYINKNENENENENEVVRLENYYERPRHTTTSFLFEIATVDNVKFSDDCVCTKHNKGHLLVTVLVLTMALVIVHAYATAI